MNTIKLNNLDIEYEVFGKGIPLVFLHGGGTDFHFYFPFLSELANYYKIYTFSYPGFGYSQNWQDYSVANFSKLINEFIKNMELKETFLNLSKENYVESI